MKTAKRIWIEMLQKWGEYQPGDAAPFSPVKGKRLIEAGIAKKVKPPRQARGRKPVETATMPTPENQEAAVAAPQSQVGKASKDQVEKKPDTVDAKAASGNAGSGTDSPRKQTEN